MRRGAIELALTKEEKDFILGCAHSAASAVGTFRMVGTGSESYFSVSAEGKKAKVDWHAVPRTLMAKMVTNVSYRMTAEDRENDMAQDPERLSRELLKAADRLRELSRQALEYLRSIGADAGDFNDGGHRIHLSDAYGITASQAMALALALRDGGKKEAK